VAVTTLLFSNHPTLSTTNEPSTTTKIPVKKLGKKDMLAELAETTKADQAQHHHEGDQRHTEMMVELENRNTRDNQRHAEKMLDKQIELRKIELCLEKERRKNCNHLHTISSDPSISSTSTSATTSQTGSPAVHGHALPDASASIAALEQLADFGIKNQTQQFNEVGLMPFNLNDFL